MDWKSFIKQLMDDFRKGEYELSAICGLSQPAIRKIRIGETKNPTQNTKKKLEQGLNIKIDDTDPSNITYARIQPTSVNETRGKYEITEMVTKEDLEMLNKLKSYGIDSVEKLESFYDYSEIVKDLEALAKTRIEKIKEKNHNQS